MMEKQKKKNKIHIRRGRYNEPGADGKDVYNVDEKIKIHMKNLKETKKRKEDKC